MACSSKSRTGSSTPTNISTKSEPLMLKKEPRLHQPGRAGRVLPVPGPKRSTFGNSGAQLLKLFGFKLNDLLELLFHRPHPPSAKVTFFYRQYTGRRLSRDLTLFPLPRSAASRRKSYKSRIGGRVVKATTRVAVAAHCSLRLLHKGIDAVSVAGPLVSKRVPSVFLR